MASTTTEVTITHKPTELHIHPSDYAKVFAARTQLQPDLDMESIPIIIDPSVPPGKIRGVGLASFTINGKIIERSIAITYNTKISDL